MEIYDIEDTSTGLKLSVEMEQEPTEQDFEQIFATYRKEGIKQLGKGYERVPQKTGRRKYKNMPTKDFLKKYVPQALGIPEDSFDINKGLDAGFGVGRAGLSFIQDPRTKTTLLKREFGDENVKIINFGGTQEHLFKDKDGKWRMVDPQGVFEFADYTSDVAGEVIPIASGIAAGLLAAPPSVAATGPASALPIAAASAGTEFSVGMAQDYVAQKLFGLDPDIAENLQRRSTSAATNFVLEFGAMKLIPLIPNAFVKSKGYDISTQDAEFLSKAIPDKIPAKLFQGDRMVSKVQEIAFKYPDSDIAKHLSKMKTNIAELGETAVGDPNLTKSASDKVLVDLLNDLNKKRLSQIDSLEKSLENISIKKDTLKTLPKDSALKARSKQEAKVLFDEQRKRIEWAMSLPEERSFNELGQVYQNQLSKSFLNADKTKNLLYEKAYEEIGDVSVSGSRLEDAFAFIKDNALLDTEGELVNSLNSAAVSKGFSAIKSLDDLTDLDIPFRTLNELIQSLRSKSGLSKSVPSFDESKYRKIVANLQDVREEMLFSSGASGKLAFEQAEEFFKNKYLPYTSGRIGNALKTRIGQNWNASKAAVKEGSEEIPLPIFENDGNALLLNATSDSSSVRDFLEFTDDRFGAKQLLRDAFLQKKGLVSGKPIDSSSLKFSEKDKGVLETLWGKEKVKSFDELRKFIADKDGYIDGISNDTFLKLTSSNTQKAEKEILNIAKEENLLKSKIKSLNATALKKLFDKGALGGDLGLNSDLIIDSLDSLSVQELKKIKKDLFVTNERYESALQNSTYNYLLKKAGQGTDEAQIGLLGRQLWNPDKMTSLLSRNEIKYRILLGDDKFDYLSSLNGGLSRISIPKGASKGGDLGLGMAGGIGGGGDRAGGFTSYISNIPTWLSNVYTKMMLSADLKSPIPKKLMDPVKFNELQSKIIKGSLVTEKGLNSYFSEAENDPRVAKQLIDEYRQLLEVSRNN